MTLNARTRFSELIHPRLNEGYRLACRLVGSLADAEDVLQEACLRAFSAIEGFEESNTRAWFLTIVRNTCYTWLERNRPRAILSSQSLGPDDRAVLEAGGSAAEAPQTPESVLIRKDEVGRLTAAIETLPLALKETFVLREYHELSYREIAEVSDVPIGTVMSRLARARQHLQTRLAASSR